MLYVYQSFFFNLIENLHIICKNVYLKRPNCIVRSRVAGKNPNRNSYKIANCVIMHARDLHSVKNIDKNHQFH